MNSKKVLWPTTLAGNVLLSSGFHVYSFPLIQSIKKTTLVAAHTHYSNKKKVYPKLCPVNEQISSSEMHTDEHDEEVEEEEEKKI